MVLYRYKRYKGYICTKIKDMTVKTKEPKYIPEPKKVISGWYFEIKCNHCGTMFQAKRRHAKYCSDTCRIMHHYENSKKEVKNETQYFTSKYDLMKYFKSLGHNIGDGVIKKLQPKEIEIKGKKYTIKRTGHSTYEVY